MKRPRLALRIATDGPADMPARWRSGYQIDGMPLRLNLGGQTNTQTIDLTGNKSYRMVQQARQISRTSLPLPQQVKDFYRPPHARGDRRSYRPTASRSGRCPYVDTSLAEEMLAKTKQIFNIRDVTVMDLSIPAVTHLGPGPIGIVAYPVSDEEPGE